MREDNHPNTYSKKKDDISNDITPINAKNILEKAIDNLFTLLEKLDVNNINQIEELYLTCYKINRTLSLLAVVNQTHHQDANTVNDALNSFGIDDLLPLLTNVFQEDARKELLLTIITIDAQYQNQLTPQNKNTGQHLEWEATHMTMLLLIRHLFPQQAYQFAEEELTKKIAMYTKEVDENKQTLSQLLQNLLDTSREIKENQKLEDDQFFYLILKNAVAPIHHRPKSVDVLSLI